MTDSVTFVGAASALLRLGAFTVLTDPNFLHAGQRLGAPGWSRRRTDPGPAMERLPTLDAILLSHAHGDHFDRVARRALPTAVPVVTNRSAGRRVQRWGFDQTIGLSTWDSTELRRGDQVLRVTAVPARHGPAGLHRAMATTTGSILDLEVPGRPRRRLYISGDTICAPDVLRQLPHRFPDIDTALIHLGGPRVLGVLVTMNSRPARDLVRLMRPRPPAPVHFDDSPALREPLVPLLAMADATPAGTQVVQRGQTINLVEPAPRQAGSRPPALR